MTRSRDVADTQDNVGGAVAPFVAGKNKIINGDFGINQRGFTSNTTSTAYNFDRWQQIFTGGSQTVTLQSFTTGAAPVSGYEGKTYTQIVTASQSATSDYSAYVQRIEGVRTFAGQTVTGSFWAKASTGTPNIGVNLLQSFGNGGSPSSDVIVAASTPVTAITSSWVRYTFTFNVPSISGKTIGTQNTDSLRFDIWTSVGSGISALGYPAVGIQNTTISIWGVQIEAGSVATPFTTASGSIGGELALCQRYYVRFTSANVFGNYAHGSAYSTTAANIGVHLPVMMRANGPISVDFSTLRLQDGVGAQTVTGLTLADSSTDYALVAPTVASGLTQYRPYFLGNNNNVAGYIGFSAEL